MEKQKSLTVSRAGPEGRRLLSCIGLISIICLAIIHLPPSLYASVTSPASACRLAWQKGAKAEADAGTWCPIPAVTIPRDDGLLLSDHLMSDKQLRMQVNRLSAAVNIPTQSYDDNGDVDEDPRWETFGDFHRLLRKLFPLTHKNLQVDHVNRYGLIFTLRGKNSSLKPVLFTAHQDVVPADETSGWTHPPFSADYDGSFLWGRGSTDCKNVLIGLLSVMEDLLLQSFEPQRTIVFAFGFDEETGGARGATELSKVLASTWGPDAFLLVLDEGGMGIQKFGDILYAYPGVGEKGYYDIQLTLHVQGGHSSKPPPHTGIGVVADMILALENNPYVPRLTDTNPFRRVLECRVRHSPDAVPSWLHHALLYDEDKEIGRKLAEEGSDEKWLVQTSQAVDVINGGIKVNALPEKIELMINHRISLHESAALINKHIRDTLTPIAHKYNLKLPNSLSFGIQTASDVAYDGVMDMEVMQYLPPSPITPTNNDVWEIFSGTLRFVFESATRHSASTMVPVSSIMTGNTDTVHYWNVSKNIYRFTPSRTGTRLNTHGTDERMEMTAHLEGMRFYYDLIRNLDNFDKY